MAFCVIVGGLCAWGIRIGHVGQWKGERADLQNFDVPKPLEFGTAVSEFTGVSFGSEAVRDVLVKGDVDSLVETLGP